MIELLWALPTNDVDIDALAEQLRADRVVVDRAAGGGFSGEYHDRLVRLAAGQDPKVYVALLDPAGRRGTEPEEVAIRLERQLGPGIYVISTDQYGPRTVVRGLGIQGRFHDLHEIEDRVELEAEKRHEDDNVLLAGVVKAEVAVRAAHDLYEAERADSDDPAPVDLPDEVVDDLAERVVGMERAYAGAAREAAEDPVDYASRGAASAWASALALLVFLFLGQTLRGWPRGLSPQRSRTTPTARQRDEERRASQAAAEARAQRRREAQEKRRAAREEAERRAEEDARRRAERERKLQREATGVPEAPPQRDRARDEVAALREALDRDAGQTVRDPELRHRAELALGLAEQLLDEAGTGADPTAAIAARQLAVTGADALRRARRGAGTRQVPCYFHPDHGWTRGRADFRLGPAEVSVPACAACAAAVTAGRTPVSLHLPGSDGTAVPYWSRDDVWARSGFGALGQELVLEVLADRRGER